MYVYIQSFTMNESCYYNYYSVTSAGFSSSFCYTKSVHVSSKSSSTSWFNCSAGSYGISNSRKCCNWVYMLQAKPSNPWFQLEGGIGQLCFILVVFTLCFLFVLSCWCSSSGGILIRLKLFFILISVNVCFMNIKYSLVEVGLIFCWVFNLLNKLVYLIIKKHEWSLYCCMRTLVLRVHDQVKLHQVSATFNFCLMPRRWYWLEYICWVISAQCATWFHV